MREWKRKNARHGKTAERGEKKPSRPAGGQRADSVRNLALSLLTDSYEGKGFSHLLLRDALEKHPEMREQDRRLLFRIVNGTLEMTVCLDYLINGCSRIPTGKMKPLVRTLLRMSAYQILFLDRVPDHAAIHEAVELSKKRKFLRLSGFVNAVLRTLQREKEEILGKLKRREYPPFVCYSLPEWLYHYLLLHYGREKLGRIGEYLLSEEHLRYVRFQDGHSEKLEGRISDRPEFLSGEMSVQDYSSQQVGLLAAPKRGERVLDLCAAPGGKSCHIAELLEGSGLVEARDLSREKVRRIEENVRRLHLSNVHTTVHDAVLLDSSLLDGEGNGSFDLVLCDVPCSGLGVLKKKPEIRLRQSMQKIRELQCLQREILTTAVRYLKPGGRLLFSTCTLSFEENEENRDFIERELHLTRKKEEKFLPGEPSDGFYLCEFIKEQ